MKLIIDLGGVEDYEGLRDAVNSRGLKIRNYCAEVRYIDISNITLSELGSITLALLECQCKIVALG